MAKVNPSNEVDRNVELLPAGPAEYLCCGMAVGVNLFTLMLLTIFMVISLLPLQLFYNLVIDEIHVGGM